MAALSGKSALVTGGSRGIGAAIAKRLAREGADVAITYSSSRQRAQQVVDEILNGGGRAVAIKADAADQVAVRAAVQQVAQEFGKIDILVNNAGLLALGSIAGVLSLILPVQVSRWLPRGTSELILACGAPCWAI